MKKIEHYKKIISENISFLKCPKCGAHFNLCSKSLICGNRHCFDIAGKGYLNFMTGTKISAEQYDAELFKARRYVFNKGFFDIILSEIKGLIARHAAPSAVIADIGCGEGSALETLINGDFLGVGIDIAKQGIMSACSGKHVNAMWIVGDLTKMPFEDNVFDIIINMLSPANYSEFDRTLKTGGIVIKILPGEDYLKQIREYFYKGSGKEYYSNEDVVNYFKRFYKKYTEMDVSYSVKTDKEYLANLVYMSPLSGGKDREAIDLFVSGETDSIDVGFKILLGDK